MTALMRKSWDMDRVVNSKHIKKDVDRAVEILLEEGFEFISSAVGSETFERIDANGMKETAILFREFANGAMLFAKEGSGEEAKRIMAWDYNREMRPNALQKSADAVKRKLRLVVK